MKKIVFIMMAMLMAVIPSTAQNYKHSKYYNQKTGHLDYGFNNKGVDTYYGIRIGPGFSYVTSDDSRLDGGDWQTGLNVGVVAGFPLTYSDPLYLETGLYYIEKGGKKSLGGGKKMTYDLNYLELPFVLKYAIAVDDEFSVQPFFGGYLACGVGGKIRNYYERVAESSFSKKYFQRFDGGLKVGCGLGYDMFYADLGYELGLTNICHDEFDKSHNGCFMLTFGVNF